MSSNPTTPTNIMSRYQSDLMAAPAKRLIRRFESYPGLQLMYPWCNGSMSVSKTVGRGSSPWGYANIDYGRVSRIGIAAAVLKTEGSEMGV